MPKLPDVDVYVAALHARIPGSILEQARRLGKRVVIAWRERGELLRSLPTRRKGPGRPRPLAIAGMDWPRTLEELEKR